MADPHPKTLPKREIRGRNLRVCFGFVPRIPWLIFRSEKCVCLTAFKSWSGFYFGNIDEEDVDPDVTERELAGPRGALGPNCRR